VTGVEEGEGALDPDMEGPNELEGARVVDGTGEGAGEVEGSEGEGGEGAVSGVGVGEVDKEEGGGALANLWRARRTEGGSGEERERRD
jgi:hypothetical protein